MSGTEAEIAAQFAPPVPKAVRNASKHADIIMAAVKANEPLPAGTTTTVVNNESGLNAQPLQHQPPAPGVRPQPPASQTENWEARYRTLEGKYNSEITPLRNQVATLSNNVSSLQGLLATLNSRPQAPQPPAPAAPTLRAEETFAKDREEYGELYDRARTWARAEIEPELAQLRSEVQKLRGDTVAQNAATAQDRVHNALDQWGAQHNIDWHIQNNDQRFIDWLTATDPFAGIVRGKMLKEAYAAGDARRVVHFFNAYADEQKALAGQQPSQTQDTRPPPPVSLETLAAPGRSGTSSAPAPSTGKRIWDSASIQKLYEDKRRGLYNGREAAYAALEQDLFAAQIEGRIVR